MITDYEIQVKPHGSPLPDDEGWRTTEKILDCTYLEALQEFAEIKGGHDYLDGHHDRMVKVE